MTQLKAIAEQCPLYGGNAVFQARGMLKVVMDDTFYDNKEICAKAENRQREEENSRILRKAEGRVEDRSSAFVERSSAKS